jgi:hypothetical protein
MFSNGVPATMPLPAAMHILPAFGPVTNTRRTSSRIGRRLSRFSSSTMDLCARSLQRQLAMRGAVDYARWDRGVWYLLKRVEQAKLETRSQDVRWCPVNVGFRDQPALDCFIQVIVGAATTDMAAGLEPRQPLFRHRGPRPSH